MQSLDLAATWPVEHASLAVVRLDRDPQPAISTWGDPDREYRIASVAKPITAWATLVAIEEGLLGLDDPAGQPGCTIRHLLAHAGGYGFDGERPISPPGRRRIYSNTGIELVAAAVAEAAAMPFDRYLREAVFEPLGMASSSLRGSPAHGVRSTVHDLCRFAHELMDPVLISRETADAATNPVFPQLAGIIPGVGRFDPCPWGLGVEIKGDKHPHWMGTTNSSTAFGHFGGAGTFLWVDLGVARPSAVACVALTDRPFDEWATEALAKWPELSDAVIAEVRGAGAMP
ncbi:MAG: serine hydrolase domain-containing protein [Ilumatobacteraceae bacterium]